MSEKTLRAFLALPLHRYFSKELSTYLKRIPDEIVDVRFQSVENLHVTLHFFGAVSMEQIQTIKEIVEPIAKNTKPFSVCVEGVGFFPDQNNPRITWLGLGHQLEPLHALRERLVRKIAAQGFEIEDRPFRPHITIGRTMKKKRVRHLDQLMPKMEATVPKDMDRIALCESRPGPVGPVYESIEEFFFS